MKYNVTISIIKEQIIQVNAKSPEDARLIVLNGHFDKENIIYDSGDGFNDVSKIEQVKKKSK